jgi:pimeloyl-ACP methyl ester carboxylesterase
MKPIVKRTLLWLLAAVGVALLIAIAAFVWWGTHPLGPTDTALAALQSDSAVTVTKTTDGWEFRPTSVDATAAYVFYPGGHVDARSYAPYLRAVAKQGYLVVLPEMPLSLAVLAPNAAGKAVSAHPEIKRWVVGGHSLGGVMAAQYVPKLPGAKGGLVLLASYPSGTNLSKAYVDAASLLGTQDTVVNRAGWQKGVALLPSSTEYFGLEGGNHAQFGDYGLQPGDTAHPTMSAVEQQRIATAATVAILRAGRSNP